MKSYALELILQATNWTEKTGCVARMVTTSTAVAWKTACDCSVKYSRKPATPSATAARPSIADPFLREEIRLGDFEIQEPQ